jgi:hypothetical protein
MGQRRPLEEVPLIGKELGVMEEPVSEFAGPIMKIRSLFLS